MRGGEGDSFSTVFFGFKLLGTEAEFYNKNHLSSKLN